MSRYIPQEYRMPKEPLVPAGQPSWPCPVCQATVGARGQTTLEQAVRNHVGFHRIAGEWPAEEPCSCGHDRIQHASVPSYRCYNSLCFCRGYVPGAIPSDIDKPRP
jgi:hypothetical protein